MMKESTAILRTYKFWEIVFLLTLLLYLVDNIFFYSMFFVTIPLTFLVGVVACIFAIRDKKYLRAFGCIIGIFLPICIFLATPW